jgi:hypothetical protein
VQPEIDVFFLRDENTDLTELMRLRRQGLRADTDYADRSRKGQLTQARRLGAKRILEPGERP